MNEEVQQETDARTDLELTIDLIAEDQELREVIGKPERVRVASPTEESDGIVTIPHMKEWPYTAVRFLTNGFWEAWAQTVLSEDDAKKFIGANLRTYQLDRIQAAIEAASGITAGKPPRSSGSQGSTKRS